MWMAESDFGLSVKMRAISGGGQRKHCLEEQGAIMWEHGANGERWEESLRQRGN